MYLIGGNFIKCKEKSSCIIQAWEQYKSELLKSLKYETMEAKQMLNDVQFNTFKDEFIIEPYLDNEFGRHPENDIYSDHVIQDIIFFIVNYVCDNSTSIIEVIYSGTNEVVIQRLSAYAIFNVSGIIDVREVKMADVVKGDLGNKEFIEDHYNNLKEMVIKMKEAENGTEQLANEGGEQQG